MPKDRDDQPFTSIRILGPLSAFLQNQQPPVCLQHGKIYRLVWVCVHVAVHQEPIACMERPIRRPNFNLRYKIGIITCHRVRHAQSEYVVVCIECISGKIHDLPEWN